MKDYVKRISEYRNACKKADELMSFGHLKEADELVKQQLINCKKAGDKEYESFFQAELSFIKKRLSKGCSILRFGIGTQTST